MTKIEQAVSGIKRRAVRNDLRLLRAFPTITGGERTVECICITEDEIREALKEIYGDDSVLDPEPSQHTP